MEPMDITEVTVVPDSPEESTKQNIVRLGGLRSQNLYNKHSRQIKPPRAIIGSGGSGNHFGSLPLRRGDSSSYRGSLVRKHNDVSHHENRNPDNECCLTNKKPSITSQASSSPNRPVVDLIGGSKEPVKLFQSNVGVTQADEFKERSALEDARSLWSRKNSSPVLHNAGDKRTVDNVIIVDSSPDSVHRPRNQYCPGPAFSKSDCSNSPKPSRQKRLVLNGCISPMNIAKAKQPVEKNNSVSRGMEESDYCTTVDTSARVNIPMQNSGDSRSRSLKGKAVLVKNSDENRTLFETRRSDRDNEKVNIYSTNRGTGLNFAGSDGWRATHSQSSRHSFLPPLSREVQPISIEDDSPNIVGQVGGNKSLRTDNNDGSIAYLGINNLISNTGPSRKTSDHPSAQCIRADGRSHNTHTTFAKRQKQSSTLSTHAECSRSAAYDLEIRSFGEVSNQSNDNLVDNGVGKVGSVINIDEVTPEQQDITSDSTDLSFRNENAVATQVELDERLAKELQEQLYNEVFAGGTNEMTDAHIALSLHHEEASHHTVSRGRRPSSNPRGSSPGQFSSRYPLNLGRGGANARAPAPSRITRMRQAFTGTAHTLSSSRGRNSIIRPTRQRNSVFPADMDVETRIRILETLESFNDMGVGNNYLQIQRDLNENDYEALLALDDNNHEHAGATDRQINGLPESIVQVESLEEACSVCLDNPTMGEVIRHLPCLHKFHKDCIDPWLRRRTSCPICKSSIT